MDYSHGDMGPVDPMRQLTAKDLLLVRDALMDVKAPNYKIVSAFTRPETEDQMNELAAKGYLACSFQVLPSGTFVALMVK